MDTVNHYMPEEKFQALVKLFRTKYGSYGIEQAENDIKMRYYLFGLFASNIDDKYYCTFGMFEAIFNEAKNLA